MTAAADGRGARCGGQAGAAACLGGTLRGGRKRDCRACRADADRNAGTPPGPRPASPQTEGCEPQQDHWAAGDGTRAQKVTLSELSQVADAKATPNHAHGGPDTETCGRKQPCGGCPRGPN